MGKLHPSPVHRNGLTLARAGGPQEETNLLRMPEDAPEAASIEALTEAYGGDALGGGGERLVPGGEGHEQMVYEHLHRYFVACELAVGRRVLDIACGEGYGTNLLARRAERVVGMDLSRKAVWHATQRYRRPNLRFKIGDGQRIPAEDQAFDLVVSFETIEHLPQPELFLSEVKRVLAPGGILVISSPDRAIYTERIGNMNAFHCSEMYHDDFLALLRTRFAQVAGGRQRLVAGSYISLDQHLSPVLYGTYRGNFTTASFHEGTNEGVYSFAVCSDHALPALRLGVLENWRQSEFIWDWWERAGDTRRRLEELERETTRLRAESTELEGRIGDAWREDERLKALWLEAQRSAHEREHALEESKGHLDVALRERSEAGARIAQLEERLAKAPEHARVDGLESELAKRLAWAHSLELELRKAQTDFLSARADSDKHQTAWNRRDAEARLLELQTSELQVERSRLSQSNAAALEEIGRLSATVEERSREHSRTEERWRAEHIQAEDLRAECQRQEENILDLRHAILEAQQQQRMSADELLTTRAQMDELRRTIAEHESRQAEMGEAADSERVRLTGIAAIALEDKRAAQAATQKAGAECDRLSLQISEFEGKWQRASRALTENNGSTECLKVEVQELGTRLAEAQAAAVNAAADAQRWQAKAREDEVAFRQESTAANVAQREEIALWQRCSQQAEQQLTAAQAELHRVLSEGRQAVLWASSLDTELLQARAEMEGLRAEGERSQTESELARNICLESKRALEQRLDVIQQSLAGETAARLWTENKVQRMQASFSWRASVPLRFLRRHLLDPLRATVTR